MTTWVELLGGVTASFLRLGRLMQKVDDLSAEVGEDSKRLDLHLANHWQYTRPAQPRSGW